MNSSLTQPNPIYWVYWCKSRPSDVAKHKATIIKQRQETRGARWGNAPGNGDATKKAGALVVSGLVVRVLCEHNGPKGRRYPSIFKQQTLEQG